MHRLDHATCGLKKITVTTGKWPQANYLSIYAMKADYTLKCKQTCGCVYIYPLFPPAHTKPENTCMEPILPNLVEFKNPRSYRFSTWYTSHLIAYKSIKIYFYTLAECRINIRKKDHNAVSTSALN